MIHFSYVYVFHFVSPIRVLSLDFTENSCYCNLYKCVSV